VGRRHHRPEQRARPERRVERTEAYRAGVERVAGEQGEHHREVVAEGAEHADDQQGEGDVRRAPDVAHALADLLDEAATPALPATVELGGPHAPQRGEHGEIARRVEEEAAPDPGGGDGDAAQRRAHDAGHVVEARVERDGARHLLARHQLRGERAPGRLLEGRRDAMDEHQRVDVPERDVAAHDQQPEDERLEETDGLADEQEVALGPAVGEHAADQGEDEDGDVLEGSDGAERERRAREVEHEPGLAQPLHPGAALGDELAREEEAVVARAQRDERARERGCPRRSAATTPSANGPSHQVGIRPIVFS